MTDTVPKSKVSSRSTAPGRVPSPSTCRVSVPNAFPAATKSITNVSTDTGLNVNVAVALPSAGTKSGLGAMLYGASMPEKVTDCSKVKALETVISAVAVESIVVGAISNESREKVI